MAGTTLVICLVDLTNGILFIGNLGDSRVLLGTMDQGVDVENIRVVSLYFINCSYINGVLTATAGVCDWATQAR